MKLTDNSCFLSDSGFDEKPDCIVYGNIPQNYTHQEWDAACKEFCASNDDVKYYHVIREGNNILAYFAVNGIDVMEDFYGIYIKILSCKFRFDYTAENNKYQLDKDDYEGMKKYIMDKLANREYAILPYVTEEINYFVIKII